jgi:hypothetical protein
MSRVACDYEQLLKYLDLLKSALFRGGLTIETLQTLLNGESEAIGDKPSHYEYPTEGVFTRPKNVPVKLAAAQHDGDSPVSESTSASHVVRPRGQPAAFRAPVSYDEESTDDSPLQYDDEQDQLIRHRVPFHDQRTVLITNLAERTTHKDLASIIRGGRLLDIFLRNDRSATISFVEGAAEFLAYAKRKDVYLHTKRVSTTKLDTLYMADCPQLEFRWADRQFHVPSHVSNKIAGGATRNLVVRGVAGKLTTDQIREHLDHIHNLVIVDICSKNGDAYISTNSIHNALFARTCMMSRTAYKKFRVEYYPDECAEPLPQLQPKARVPAPHLPTKPMPIVNQYALLDTGSDVDSGSETESYLVDGIRLDGHSWADPTAA